MQWRVSSPFNNVARVQIPVWMPYVGWVCWWFPPLLWEVFLRVLRFSPLLKNQHSKFQFDQETSRWRTTLWMCHLIIIFYLFIYIILYYTPTHYMFFNYHLKFYTLWIILCIMQVSFHEYTIHILRRTLYFNCCKLFLTKTSVSHIKVQECIFSLSDVNIWRSVTVSKRLPPFKTRQNRNKKVTNKLKQQRNIFSAVQTAQSTSSNWMNN